MRDTCIYFVFVVSHLRLFFRPKGASARLNLGLGILGVLFETQGIWGGGGLITSVNKLKHFYFEK